jgi:hypothetical protein
MTARHDRVGERIGKPAEFARRASGTARAYAGHWDLQRRAFPSLLFVRLWPRDENSLPTNCVQMKFCSGGSRFAAPPIARKAGFAAVLREPSLDCAGDTRAIDAGRSLVCVRLLARSISSTVESGRCSSQSYACNASTTRYTSTVVWRRSAPLVLWLTNSALHFAACHRGATGSRHVYAAGLGSLSSTSRNAASQRG